MRRVQLPQLTRQPWFPTVLRDRMHEFLVWFVMLADAGKPFLPVIERGLAATDEKRIFNCDFAPGAGMNTLQPYLDPGIQVEDVPTNPFAPSPRGLYTFVNSLHALPPDLAREYLTKIAAAGNPVVAVEGNNDNWWQAIGMLLFVPLSVLVFAPFVKPFRISRLVFTYLIPVLPFLTSYDGALALFKLYSPDDLRELTSTIRVPGYRWEAGKLPNGRGGKILYLLGTPER